MVLEDHRLTKRDLETLITLLGSVGNILADVLGFRSCGTKAHSLRLLL